MFRNFKELSDSIPSAERTLVVAAAHDKHTLEAVLTAADNLDINYILVGNSAEIELLLSQLGKTPDKGSIINEPDSIKCARKAVALIKEGAGDALMKGLLDTGTMLKAVLDKETGIRDSGTLSHLAILETPGYHKLIGITDGGMIPNPVLEQKADIVKNAVMFFKRLGYEKPNVAALCASETVNPKIPETIEAAELQIMCRNGELGDCLLEGPLSFDLAISRESADIKGFSSRISGETDILLVPNFTVGNVLAKGLIYCAGAKMAGIVLGAKVPVVLTSRGASMEEKLFSIMLSILYKGA
ncbi:MAG: phosphate acyltransferase [Oscillospiraceae bacterium]|nr:phosphate acyltransferase [Oscillospiraceae bacterium]